MRRVGQQLEAEVRYHLLPVSKGLKKYERMVINSRVKDCESALQKLRGKQEGATFNHARPELYSLTSLSDLAGVRVLAFPTKRLTEIDEALRKVFCWKPDPVIGDDEMLAFKYCGYCKASRRIKGEYQIVSMLIGLFWEVEHSAMYKPDPQLRFMAEHRELKQMRARVLETLKAFEEEFEKLLPAR
jgi:ppGpp synthetase/RelA/SpoT-type nucleotidyltranferase